MSSNIQPAAPRLRAFMPAREIARNFSGGPVLVVSSALAEGADFGRDTLFVGVTGAQVRFFRDASEDFVEIAELPADLLAVVVREDEAAPLRALWEGYGLGPPSMIVVAGAAQAVGAMVARAQAEIASVSRRCAELQSALVATRAEFEETRSAMQGVMRTLSHRYATKMNLVAVAPPSRDKIATLAPLQAMTGAYPVSTEAVTCIALHVASLKAAARAVLGVKLLGVESGRVLGAWQRPGEALFAGWNVFDFPTPVAAVRETLAIEVALQGAEGSAVALSLSDAAEPRFAARIWTADPGGRFPHAEHWVWSAPGAVRPAAGTVALVGADTLSRIVARGRIEIVRDGKAASYLLRGGSSLLQLKGLSIHSAEAVLVELRNGFGELRGTRFELAVQSGEHCFAGGWQSFAAGETALKLGLSLPASLPDAVDLYIRVEDGERAPGALAGFAVQQVEIVAGERSTLEAAAAPRILAEAWPPADADPSEPCFAAVKATNYSETEKFAWFDVALEGLQFDGRVERRLKFKISMAQTRLSLEFRRGPAWPAIFAEWPGREQDRFGDVFRIADAGERLAIAGELTAAADHDLSAALCRLMPIIVTAGIQSFPAAQGRSTAWLDAARAFAAAADGVFDGLAA
ncbi:MAG TPA: DUF6212 domain-containing protein [Rhizomicrobium sp.]|nr:DUF6212 domain-containing protein [Rhizomicrobium sp.]